jgi:hypothetical protein
VVVTVTVAITLPPLTMAGLGETEQLANAGAPVQVNVTA